MDDEVVRGQFMGERTKGRSMDYDVGGGRFPINIVSKLIGFDRNGEVKEVNIVSPMATVNSMEGYKLFMKVTTCGMSSFGPYQTQKISLAKGQCG